MTITMSGEIAVTQRTSTTRQTDWAAEARRQLDARLAVIAQHDRQAIGEWVFGRPRLRLLKGGRWMGNTQYDRPAWVTQLSHPAQPCGRFEFGNNGIRSCCRKGEAK